LKGLIGRNQESNGWKKEGDLNTQFFHKDCNVVLIRNEWCEEPSRVKEEGSSKILQEKIHEFKRVQLLLDNVSFPVISSEDNEALVKTISMEEMKQAVWGSDNNKCLGLDEFNFSFFKEF